jgi:hypothetical protein
VFFSAIPWPDSRSSSLSNGNNIQYQDLNMFDGVDDSVSDGSISACNSIFSNTVFAHNIIFGFLIFSRVQILLTTYIE